MATSVSPVAGDDERRLLVGQRGGAQPGDAEALAVELTGCAPPAERRQHEPGRLAGRPRRGRSSTTWSRLEDVTLAAPWSSKSSDTAARGSIASASGQPSSARAASSAAPVCDSVGVAEAPLEELQVVAVHQRSFPRSRSRRAMMLRWISALPP